MIARAMRWRFVLSIIATHVVIDAGSTFLAWHQALGSERWASMRWDAYEAVALYVKLAVGVCTTVLTLRDNTWHKTKEATT